MENEKSAQIEKQQEKPKRKKKGRIERVFEMHEKGVSVKDIASKMKLSERVVRSYVWRKQNPEKFKALLGRYFEKRRQRLENEKIKAAVKENQNQK